MSLKIDEHILAQIKTAVLEPIAQKQGLYDPFACKVTGWKMKREDHFFARDRAYSAI